MAAPRKRSRQPRPMDAGVLGAEIGSFRLHLAAEGKAPKTIRLYTEAGDLGRIFFVEHRVEDQSGQPRRPHAPAEASTRTASRA
jgi:hypothetical protein